MSLWRSEAYQEALKEWPTEGKVILAQYNDEAVCVYQAFNVEIARYAVKHQRFSGCEYYSPSRMTWFKTNFLWMQYRSGWGVKKSQVATLAIWLRREAFERYLAAADTKLGDVRLQWDPDHHPSGAKHASRRAIQIGLRAMRSFADGSDIVRIEDVSQFVHEQGKLAKAGNLEELLVARERVYTCESEEAKQVFAVKK